MPSKTNSKTSTHPKTPEDLKKALQDPYSPYAQEFWLQVALIKVDIAREECIVMLLEKALKYQQDLELNLEEKSRAEKNAAKLKKIFEDLENSKVIIQDHVENLNLIKIQSELSAVKQNIAILDRQIVALSAAWSQNQTKTVNHMINSLKEKPLIVNNQAISFSSTDLQKIAQETSPSDLNKMIKVNPMLSKKITDDSLENENNVPAKQFSIGTDAMLELKHVLAITKNLSERGLVKFKGEEPSPVEILQIAKALKQHHVQSKNQQPRLAHEELIINMCNTYAIKDQQQKQMKILQAKEQAILNLQNKSDKESSLQLTKRQGS